MMQCVEIIMFHERVLDIFEQGRFLMIIPKMFGDYYKNGVVSRKLYGTFSGKEIKVAKYNISKQHY